MPVVELRLTPLPSHVRTARIVVVAAARRAGLADTLIDELRFALGEACSRAVGLHRRHAPQTPVVVRVADSPGVLAVTVSDRGPAAGPVPQDMAAGMFDGGREGEDEDAVDPDVALALLTGLVDDIRIEPGPEGTDVTLRWPLAPRIPA